jgi:Na+/melibiose symporter-like transporter
LFPFLGGILAVYIALLVAWTVVDPPVASQYRQSLESDQFMMVCQTGSSGIIIFAIILGWSCVLLLVGIVLSFLTRNLAEAYNESKPVSLSVYIYSFSAVILIPILFSKFRGSRNDKCQNNGSLTLSPAVPNALVVFIVTDAVLVFSTLVTLIALYLSKIVRIKKGLGDKVSTGLSTSMTPPTSTAPMSNTGSMAVPDSNRKIELENQLLRERIADLEKQLRARPEY